MQDTNTAELSPPQASGRPTASAPAGARQRAGALPQSPWQLALATAIPLTIAYLLARPPSGDLAAATYRGEVWSRAGFTLWDNGWYGGHYLPGYSLLAPALGALAGERVLLCLSTLAAAAVFGVIARRIFNPPAARVAAVTFAVGVCVTMLSGRVAFSLGLALGLLAVLALLGNPRSMMRTVLAVALALLSSLASPVAGAFVALVGVADALAGRPRRGLALAAAALAPIALFALAFPEGGYEPFAPSVFWPALGGVALIALLLPRLGGDRSRETLTSGEHPRFDRSRETLTSGEHPRFDRSRETLTSGEHPRFGQRALAIGAWLYALALIGSFTLQTPVGSNAARLGELFAAPLVAGALWERRRLALLALAPALLYWQLETPINDFAALKGDPSVNAGYYAPLLHELQRRAHGAPLRVEVPQTGAHWESVYLPEHGSILLARGWERQLDTRYGALFYGEGPAAAAYRAWLYENAISYVALPDVRLDFSAEAEGRLITRGLPYLREVWHSPRWRLFAVAGAPALAQPPARLLAVGVDSFTLAAPRPGSYVVRVRYTPYWALRRGHGCVRRAAGGWTAVQVHATGTVRVGIDFALTRIFSNGPRCA